MPRLSDVISPTNMEHVESPNSDLPEKIKLFLPSDCGTQSARICACVGELPEVEAQLREAEALDALQGLRVLQGTRRASPIGRASPNEERRRPWRESTRHSEANNSHAAGTARAPVSYRPRAASSGARRRRHGHPPVTEHQHTRRWSAFWNSRACSGAHPRPPQDNFVNLAKQGIDAYQRSQCGWRGLPSVLRDRC